MTETRLVPPGATLSGPKSPKAKSRRLALAVICVGTMMAFVNVSSTIGALARIQADLHSSPTAIVWITSAGLLVAPSTAAAVNSVPPAQAGMASSVVNMFRQLGNVLGASVLGTILTSKFADNLGADLTSRKLPAPVVDQIVTGAKHGSGAAGLPANLASVVGDAVRHSFNDAFHTGLVVAGVFVLVAALPTVLLVRHRPAH